VSTKTSISQCSSWTEIRAIERRTSDILSYSAPFGEGEVPSSLRCAEQEEKRENKPATQKNEPADATDATLAKDPIDPMEQELPIEPMLKELPIDPIEQNEPIEPIDHALPIEPRDLREPRLRQVGS
jgi:hypothetical protein